MSTYARLIEPELPPPSREYIEAYCRAQSLARPPTTDATHSGARPPGAPSAVTASAEARAIVDRGRGFVDTVVGAAQSAAYAITARYADATIVQLGQFCNADRKSGRRGSFDRR